jgi:iron complex outermembrane receptor protein
LDKYIKQQYLLRALPAAVALALLSMNASAQALQAGSTQPPTPADASTQAAGQMQKVEVTGSSIKRSVADQALPVTVTKAEDWIAQGAITVEDILMQMSTASDYVPATVSGTGNSANMRGIGGSRTLVLLDGKRLSDSSIDPNNIPVSALDRTEVLRDGASSIYGSDAIGGVINFVTKTSYTGGSITAKGATPQRAGGGQSEGLNFIFGKGDLATDGWNVYVTGDLNHQNPLAQSARPNITSEATRVSAGFAPAKLSKGSNAVPANVTLVNGSSKNYTGNPYYATGCLAPWSTPGTSNTCSATAGANSLTLTKENEQASFFSKGTLMLNPDHRLSASILYSSIHNRPVKNPTFGIDASIANFPALTITPASKYYPGKGITPAMTGITNQTLTLAWSLIGDLGPTVLDYNTRAARMTVEDEGRIGAWDYRASLWSALNSSHTTFRSGFVNSYGLLAGVADGTLNPFGLQDSTGRAYLDRISTNGQTASAGVTRMNGLDLTANRDLMELKGGTMALAVGASAYHDFTYNSIPETVALSGGQTGGTAAANQHASRNVVAAYVELDMPITRALDVDAAVRTDRYSDFGSTTNPKVSFRYKPSQAWMLRGAVGTGFRAPTLGQRYFGAVNGPTGITSTGYNDPVLCPGGLPGGNTGGTALPGYDPAVVCNARKPINSGANPNVGPERSTTFNFGIVLTPTRTLLVSLDYFNVKLRDMIGQIAQPAFFTNPAYANLFIRDANKNLLYIDDRQTNLGGLRTDGLDLTATYTFPKTRWGTFGAQLDGTYVNRFETQVDRGGPWISSINKFGPLDANVMNFRWKYGASVKWVSPAGDWTSTLNEQYKQSFEDLNNGTQFYHTIDPYTLFNWSLTYAGYRQWKVLVGVNNVFNRDPPAANYRGEGYASGEGSPLGRTFLARATYNF